jgi:hypothetical protein
LRQVRYDQGIGLARRFNCIAANNVNILHILKSESALARALAWIEHKEDEERIVQVIAQKLDDPSTLTPIRKGRQLWVAYRGTEFHIPLTDSRHDRYITISSLAKIMEKDYVFWLEQESLGGETHGLLVLRYHDLAQLDVEIQTDFMDRFVCLEIGYDYFSGLRIPYTQNVNNNPMFKQEYEQFKVTQAQFLDSLVKDFVTTDVITGMKSEINRVQNAALWRRLRNITIAILACFIVIRLGSSLL